MKQMLPVLTKPLGVIFGILEIEACVLKFLSNTYFKTTAPNGSKAFETLDETLDLIGFLETAFCAIAAQPKTGVMIVESSFLVLSTNSGLAFNSSDSLNSSKSFELSNTFESSEVFCSFNSLSVALVVPNNKGSSTSLSKASISKGNLKMKTFSSWDFPLRSPLSLLVSISTFEFISFESVSFASVSFTSLSFFTLLISLELSL
ncbi:hypothetical protein WICMUC_002522 [Wickerhamomyces mucosus]|uniref:Uncharacterized protein n=1 Tax=Wickerhamomyces mucosus TaxID=1378264 RepID=A0A9P8PQA9_9ASCO|nr:hypothetical protein WICMUC_002522 [Wickerhamomyces mucosus]